MTCVMSLCREVYLGENGLTTLPAGLFDNNPALQYVLQPPRHALRLQREW